MIKKPMLAATIESHEDLDRISYPVYVSPKLDGVRCITDENGTPFTRMGEPFASSDLNRRFQLRPEWKNLDGELGIGDPTDKKFFTKTSGSVRREDDTLNETVTFYVFDRVGEGNFDARWWKNKVKEQTDGNLRLVWVDQILCQNKAEVLKWEEMYVRLGYEGIMVRGNLTSAEYKHGRASLISQQLMKLKRFADAEGIIIGFEEGNTNNNVAEKNAFGRTKRGSAKAGKEPNGRVGVLIVKSEAFEEPVRIGTGIGLTHELRKDMWEQQEAYLGRTVTFCYQAGSDYTKARFPSFKSFRDDGI